MSRQKFFISLHLCLCFEEERKSGLEQNDDRTLKMQSAIFGVKVLSPIPSEYEESNINKSSSSNSVTLCDLNLPLGLSQQY